MLKADVLAILEANKDKPIIVGLGDEGQVLYGGIEGHWLFVKGENLVEIRKVTATKATSGIGTINSKQSPFSIYTTPFDVINYVETFIPAEPGKIAAALNGLTPAGTSKTLAEVEAEIESDSILKSLTARGNVNVSDVAPGKSYGKFSGSAVSTSIDGIPKYMKEALIDDDNNE